jgi:hypothetical protein
VFLDSKQHHQFHDHPNFDGLLAWKLLRRMQYPDPGLQCFLTTTLRKVPSLTCMAALIVRKQDRKTSLLHIRKTSLQSVIIQLHFIILVNNLCAADSPKEREVNWNFLSSQEKRRNFWRYFSTGTNRLASLRSILVIKSPGSKSCLTASRPSILKREYVTKFLSALQVTVGL